MKKKLSASHLSDDTVCRVNMLNDALLACYGADTLHPLFSCRKYQFFGTDGIVKKERRLSKPLLQATVSQFRRFCIVSWESITGGADN